MKINICCGYTNKLENFSNFNFFNEDDYEKLNIDEINQYIDDGEIDEILAINTINFIDYKNIYDVLKTWFHKLKYGGTITLSFFDIVEASRLLTVGKLNIDEARKIIYGNQNINKDYFKSGATLEEVKNIFNSFKCTIEFCKRDEYISYIKARRLM